MALPGLLLNFGLKQLFDVGSKEASDWLDGRFHDSSRDVLRTVFEANRRAWNVVGLALIDRTLLERVSDPVYEADFKAARNAVRQLLGLLPVDQRGRAADELSALQERCRALDPEKIEGADALRRFSDPAGVAADADRAAGALPDTLPDAPTLVVALNFRPDGRVTLFQTFYRYYFWKLVRTSSALSWLLTLDQLRALAEAGDRQTAVILDQVDALFEYLGVKFAEVSAKLDAGFAGVSADLREIKERLAAPRKAGVSYDTDPERAFLLNAREQFRKNAGKVSAGQWEQLGDALNEARLYAEASEAHEAAATTAHAVRDRGAEAANHYKTYLDACEAGKWEPAFAAVWKAVELEPVRYAPFDRYRYRPERILGGGAFGTVFLCRDQYEPDENGNPRLVAIKSFRKESLARDLEMVFGEARVLKTLAHPNIIGVIDQGFGNTQDRERPYLVLDYFSGQTLDAFGTIKLPDFFAIARKVAEAVHAAHARPKPIYHRDLKPSNIMVLRSLDGTWTVKVIDFGLAVRAADARASLSVAHANRSTKDRSVTGTVKYAPPEQLGELRGVEIGPYSDVYSFGKTCLDMLFGTTAPKRWDWEQLPSAIQEGLQELLERCTVDRLEYRHPNFAPVMAALAELDPAEKTRREQLAREESERKQQIEAVARAEQTRRVAAEAARVAREQQIREEARQEAMRQAAEAHQRDQQRRAELERAAEQLEEPVVLYEIVEDTAPYSDHDSSSAEARHLILRDVLESASEDADHEEHHRDNRRLRRQQKEEQRRVQRVRLRMLTVGLAVPALVLVVSIVVYLILGFAGYGVLGIVTCLFAPVFAAGSAAVGIYLVASASMKVPSEPPEPGG